MKNQFVLIVYDISHDRRRTKLHNVLLDYGTSVQYSVFECLVEARDLDKLKSRVRKVTRPKTDNVRYYYLCENCVKKVEAPGGEVVAEPPGALVA